MCIRDSYKSVDGVTATTNAGVVTLTWQGEAGAQLRAQFSIVNGTPMVLELAARQNAGAWIVLGKNLKPGFQVTTGKRRISNKQLQLLKQMHLDTPERIDADKWNTFWDAPLVVPGDPNGDTTDLPRKPEEIRHDSVKYQSDKCSVSTDGDRVSVIFNGLTLGIFSGDLQFTAYKGSNLLLSLIHI